MSKAKGQFYVTAYRFRDAANKRGPVISLGRSKTNFTSEETAIKAVASLVPNKDGANFAYVHGPGSTTPIITL